MDLQPVEGVEELLVGAHLVVGGGDLLDHPHQGFGDETPAVDAEVAADVRVVRGRFGDGGTGAGQVGARRTCHQRVSGPASGRTGGFRR